MSEKPFSKHERLNTPELETIKRDISALLIDMGLEVVTISPSQDGASFRISAPRVEGRTFLQSLQAIAVEYDEHIVFEVTNRENLIIEVRDESTAAKPTLN